MWTERCNNEYFVWVNTFSYEPICQNFHPSMHVLYALTSGPDASRRAAAYPMLHIFSHHNVLLLASVTWPNTRNSVGCCCIWSNIIDRDTCGSIIERFFTLFEPLRLRTSCILYTCRYSRRGLWADTGRACSADGQSRWRCSRQTGLQSQWRSWRKRQIRSQLSAFP